MACSTLKRQKSCSDHPTLIDHISQLPEPIITTILSDLPTKEAIQTCVLSKEWRYNWRFVNNFHFNDDSSKDFINKSLRNHNVEPISKFLFRWHYSKCESLYLKKWASIAIIRSVRHLELRSVNEYDYYATKLALPPSLYTSGTIETLKLEGYFLIKPSKVVSLPRLSEMELTQVMYESNKAICNLISGCPVLYSLKIVRTHKDDQMEVCTISSPVLKYLNIDFNRSHYCDDSEIKLEINAPTLESLYLMDYMSDSIVIHPQLVSVNKVLVDVIAIEPDMMVEIVRALGTVKYLHLQATRLIRPPRWSYFIDMLDGCTELKEFVLDYHESEPFEDALSNLDRGVPICLSSSLKLVKFRAFYGRVEEMSILKFFLAHGTVLETVAIRFPYELEEGEKVEISGKVLELSTASPSCRIHFH